MKKILLLVLVNFSIISVYSQWCVPTTVLPYSIDMPGITHVVFNTIDRISSDLEDYPNNNYTNTGLSTSVVRGMTYSFSMTYTIDPSICPDMNLRVWIDYNHNYLFTFSFYHLLGFLGKIKKYRFCLQFSLIGLKILRLIPSKLKWGLDVTFGFWAER